MYLFIKSKTTHNLSTVHRYGATHAESFILYAEPNKKKPGKRRENKVGTE